MTSPYPLLFDPVLLPKVWGGNRLATLGKHVSASDRIGESWEVADLDVTSDSGAGGGAVHSRIANGPLKGRTLRDAIGRWGALLLGHASPTRSGAFPILVKYLDARENLSVQVHPSPAYAAAHPGSYLKTECWYVIDAAPDSVIYAGLRPGVTRESFRASIEMGNAHTSLVARPAIQGELHLLPSGTCHALGAGVLVAEVQTPSDTTFRVYDWGRVGRALHIQESLECIQFASAPAPVQLHAPSGGQGPCVHTPFFEVSHVEIRAGSSWRVPHSGSCAVLLALSGAGQLTCESGAFEPTPVAQGSTVLVPACVGAALNATLSPLRCLLVTLPPGKVPEGGMGTSATGA